MYVLRLFHGLLVGIAHEEHLHVLPGVRILHVLHVDEVDGNASLDEGVHEAEEVGNLGIVGLGHFLMRAVKRYELADIGLEAGLGGDIPCDTLEHD